MANINLIEHQYKEILSDLNPKEVEAYIEALTEKLIETYPTATSYFFNIERYKQIDDSIKECTEFYKSKYPSVIAYEYGSKYHELNKKYGIETEKAYYSFMKYELAHVVDLIGNIIIKVKYLLSSVYSYYIYMLYMKWELLIEEVGFSEEDLEPFHDIIYNKNATNFHGNKALDVVNSFIKLELKEVETYINFFYQYPKFTYDETAPEEVIEIIDSYNEIRSEGYNYIKILEELKEEPFKDGIESLAKIETDSSYIKDSEAYYNNRLNYYKSNAPSYNFETFEIILPNTETTKGVGNND